MLMSIYKSISKINLKKKKARRGTREWHMLMASRLAAGKYIYFRILKTSQEGN